MKLDTDKEFLDLCKDRLIKYTKENKIIEQDEQAEVYIVWYNKTLQNKKAILITNAEDQRLYKCTYNGDSNQLYIDVYSKEKNIGINIEDNMNIDLK